MAINRVVAGINRIHRDPNFREPGRRVPALDFIGQKRIIGFGEPNVASVNTRPVEIEIVFGQSNERRKTVDGRGNFSARGRRIQAEYF